jgi:hypothetical protein
MVHHIVSILFVTSPDVKIQIHQIPALQPFAFCLSAARGYPFCRLIFC